MHSIEVRTSARSQMIDITDKAVHNGKLFLGTWQEIYFCEFDGPRKRTCLVKVIKSPGNDSGA